MPTIEVNIPRPDPITDITRSALQALITGSTVQPLMWYRITDATPAPIIVRGVAADEISTEAHLEGTFDGSNTTYGGFGTYDIETDVFKGAIYDIPSRVVYNGTLPTDNTNASPPDLITYGNYTLGNSNGEGAQRIIYQQNNVNNINGDACENIFYSQNCYDNINGVSAVNIFYGQNCVGNENGNSAQYLTYGQGVVNFLFGDNFRNCTIWPNLNGNKADNSAPIDFITNATLIYNRSTPWEIIDIDRTAELIYVRFTYGDGSDPEEGWYNPATDVFTPVSSGSGVQSVSGNIVDNTDPLNPVVDQVQPDWNASSGLGEILNKPTIPAAQVNSDWNAVSGVAQILNKPTIPTTVIVPDTFVRNGQNQTFAAGTTRYLAVVGISGNTLTAISQAAQKITRGGVIPSIGFTLGSTQPGTGSLVITLMRGATIASIADTAAVITIPANSVAGEYTYTGNITVNDGDYLVWKVVNNASGASGQDFGSWFVLNRTITLS